MPFVKNPFQCSRARRQNIKTLFVYSARWIMAAAKAAGYWLYASRIPFTPTPYIICKVTSAIRSVSVFERAARRPSAGILNTARGNYFVHKFRTIRAPSVMGRGGESGAILRKLISDRNIIRSKGFRRALPHPHRRFLTRLRNTWTNSERLYEKADLFDQRASV